MEHPSGQQPIFILSCARSGSTMLRCIIDTHPNLCSPGHLNLGPLCRDLYVAAYYSLGKLPDVQTEAQRDQLAIKETRLVVTDLLGRYAQGKGKQNWCEKSTVNLDHLKILQKVFPDAKYICLYRSCMDVVHSCIKFNPLGYMSELAAYVQKHPGSFVAAMTDHWLEKSRKLMAFERAHAGQCFRVRYESLVQNPEPVLAALFDFLGEPWDEALIDSIFKTPHDQGDGDLKVWFSGKINQDSMGNGVEIPLSAIPDEFIADINAMHHSLGYPSLEEFYAETVDAPVLHDLNVFFQDALARPDRSGLLQGVCRFVISGKNGGVWTLAGDQAGLSLKANDAPFDCQVSTSHKVFCALIEGSQTAVKAYEQGEITGSGNLNLALAFGRFLFGGDG